jgi:hypothetical protein
MAGVRSSPVTTGSVAALSSTSSTPNAAGAAAAIVETSTDEQEFQEFQEFEESVSISILCCKLAYANPGTVNSAVPVPVKSTGVQLILVLPQDEKS